MTTKFRKFATAAAFAFASLGMAGTAHAECSSGFIAGTLCQMGVIDEGTSQVADGLNARLGQPVDNAIYNAADAMVPGSGTVARGYAQVQRSGVFSNRGAPAPQGYPQQGGNRSARGGNGYQGGYQGGYQQQGYAPSYSPSYAPPVVQTYQCNTPYGSALVGYLMNPGTPCTVMTYNGPVQGIAGF